LGCDQFALNPASTKTSARSRKEFIHMSNDHESVAALLGHDDRFSVTVATTGDVVVFKLVGEVDETALACLDSALESCRHVDTSSVLIDLRDVTFLSSRALGILVCAHADLAEHGCHVELSECSGVARRLIGVAETAGMLPQGLWAPPAAEQRGAATSGVRTAPRPSTPVHA